MKNVKWKKGIQLNLVISFLMLSNQRKSVKKLQKISHQYPRGSAGYHFFHLLGEVEVVFGIWAAVFFLFLMLDQGPEKATQYIESLNFTEPGFVFVIMVLCSTRPILSVARSTMDRLSNCFKFIW